MCYSASLTLLTLALASLPVAAHGQEQPVTRVYLTNPADEDWSFLREPGTRTDRWDAWKYIPLGDDDRYLTLNGEVRYRPEGFRVRGVGDRSATSDGYLLQRYLFGADAHLGPHVQIYSDLQAGIINGKFGSPRPTDRNVLDLHQAFVEFRQHDRRRDGFVGRIGRQELSIGSSRLISASPGLNVKRSFDGATMTYRHSSWSVAAAVAELVPLNTGVFDDGLGRGQLFWGLAAGRRSPWLRTGELGVYYLGIDRDLSTYAQGVGSESRHTIGFKWNGTRPQLDLNYDAVVQWGRFAGAPIRAWAFATETGYRFTATRWRPRIGVRSDIASGDENAADRKLQSFDPLFPGNSYSGAVGLFGPTNLTDLTPAITLLPTPKMVLGFEAATYWRTSTADGIYSTNLRLLLPPGIGSGRYVGTNPAILATYQLTRHLQAQGVVTRFISGGFLEKTFVAKGFGFYSVTGLYRF